MANKKAPSIDTTRRRLNMNVLLLSWFTSLTFSFSSGFSPVTGYLDRE